MNANVEPKLAAGDLAAFELLMRRWNRRLFRIARAVLNNDEEAEDALQEAYLHAYRALGQFQGDAQLSTWLARVVLNECYARLRKQARRQNVIPLVSCEDEMHDHVPEDPDRAPDRALARAELRTLLERKLDALPEDFRVVFMLRCVEEMSVEETAACLDIPAATVRSRHFRARSLLRESLARDVDVAERDMFDFLGERCDRIVERVKRRLGESG